MIIRTTWGPEDLDRILHLHQALYTRDFGFDETFADHVAVPLRAFAQAPSTRERLWLAEAEDRLAGCIATVAAEEQVAQLRWFLVDPAFRGQGIGNRLIEEAIAFARSCHYESIILWTVNLLQEAAHLYRKHGFQKIEEHPGTFWGVEMVEEKYGRKL